MFGIGSTELLVILVVALLVLGPKNLPKVAQSLGKAMGEFRRYSTEFQRNLNTEIAFEDHKKKEDEAEKDLTEAVKTEKPVPPAPQTGTLEIPNPATTVAAETVTDQPEGKTEAVAGTANEQTGTGDKA